VHCLDAGFSFLLTFSACLYTSCPPRPACLHACLPSPPASADDKYEVDFLMKGGQGGSRALDTTGLAVYSDTGAVRKSCNWREPVKVGVGRVWRADRL
jgi:hypothetical protein